ncbi:MAG: cation:proton antiporter [Bacteroidetes bacterium]|nr:cation:proton antiporter [Bacteroidota bacterium]
MNVPIFFALMGGIILLGFLANLLFKWTKIPSVLLLMGIGVFLGPVTGWLASDALLTIAPYFGTMALLIILFEGGLELDIRTVVQQAPKAAVLAVGVFVVSVVLIMCFGIFVMDMSTLNALILAAVLGATSPAICIPVVSGLSVRNEIKTIVKLESALGDVLLIVSVLLLLDFHVSGTQGVGSVLMSFVTSFGVALVIATVTGALWSRLIAWMGKEPLAYMLTLGFIFLLYFMVEELHGSAAIAVLMFGLILENMQVMTDHIGIRLRQFFGIDIKSEKFVLNQFIKNITEEISFLLRTFFFVYLGMLLDFDELTWTIGLFILGMTLLLLVGRRLLMIGFRRIGKDFTEGELQAIMAMLPRGLATAVMALLPFQTGHIPGTELFPMYAFGVIVLTNLYMTGSVMFAERRLKSERLRSAEPLPVGYAGETAAGEILFEKAPAAPSLADAAAIDAAAHAEAGSASGEHGTQVDEPQVDREEHTTTEGMGAARPTYDERYPPFEAALFSAEDEREAEPPPQTFTEWMARIFGIHSGDRERGYLEAYRAAHITEPLYWVQIMLAAGITTLGLILDQSAIIIGGALIMPIMFPVLAAGLSLASGDLYLLIRIFFKVALTVFIVGMISAILSDLLPFAEVTKEIAARTRPTVIDFLVALFAGMAGAATLSRKNRFVQFLPAAIIAITLLPPIAVMGFGIANGGSPEIIQGGALLFTANFFANILGAMIVFLLVGMPKAATVDVVRKWKEKELAHPVISIVFEKLRLSQVVGRTGSVRARFFVIALFLLILMIPLQSALNQLTLELRARQAISEIARAFDIKYRSSLINTSSRISDDLIEVKLQVATNSFFTSADIARFEERVSDRTGVPTRLDLVQSLSDIGKGSTVSELLTPSSTGSAFSTRTFSEAVGDLRFQAQSILRSIPLSSRLEIVSMNAELTLDTLSPAINFIYLSDEPLTEDARDILGTLIAGRLSLPANSLQFNWFSNRYAFDVASRMEFNAADRVRLRNLNNLLMRYPQLALSLQFPEVDRGAYRFEPQMAELLDHVPLAADSTRVTVRLVAAPRDSLVARLSVKGLLPSSGAGKTRPMTPGDNGNQTR